MKTRPVVGQKYRVIEEGSRFKIGEIVVLHIDDGTNCPYFKSIKTNKASACKLRRLEPLTKTLDTLEVGDVLVEPGQCQRTVIAVCGRAIAVSDTHYRDEIDGWWTPEQIHQYGYKLKDQPETPELTTLTLQEVADLKGIPVEQLRIAEVKE